MSRRRHPFSVQIRLMPCMQSTLSFQILTYFQLIKLSLICWCDVSTHQLLIWIWVWLHWVVRHLNVRLWIADGTTGSPGVCTQPHPRMGCGGDLACVHGRMPVRHQRGTVVPAALRMGSGRNRIHWGAHYHYPSQPQYKSKRMPCALDWCGRMQGRIGWPRLVK